MSLRASLLLLLLFAALTLSAVPTQEVAINPLFAPFGTFSAEYQNAFRSDLSAGVHVWIEVVDVESRFGYAKLLYRPFKRHLESLGIGPTFGVITRYKEDEDSGDRDHETAPTLGIMAEYNWLVGAKKNILLGVGFNAHRVIKHLDDLSPLRTFDGDLRLMLGYAW